MVVGTCLGVSLPRTEQTALRRNRDYFLIYKTACYFIFRAVGPLVALVVLNGELVRALRAVRRRRRRLLVQKANARGRNGSGGGENLTLMLVTVVTVFIVCQLPNLGIRIAYTAYEFAPRGVIQLDIPGLDIPGSSNWTYRGHSAGHLGAGHPRVIQLDISGHSAGHPVAGQSGIIQLDISGSFSWTSRPCATLTSPATLCSPSTRPSISPSTASSARSSGASSCAR